MNDRSRALVALFGLNLQLVAQLLRRRYLKRINYQPETYHGNEPEPESSTSANPRKRGRRWWVRPRPGRFPNQKSLFKTLMEAKKTNHELFFNYTRCLPHQFDKLVALLRPHFPEHRSIRRPFSVEFRLVLTLSYLADGTNRSSHAARFGCGLSTAHKHIPETCSALWQVLQPVCLPDITKAKLTATADGFMKHYQYPNCLGALGGRHIQIQCPSTSMSQHSYSGDPFSVALIGTCDVDYQFTWVDISHCGSLEDKNVWSSTSLASELEQGILDLPSPQQLLNSPISLPFSYVADENFPLKPYIMTPYDERGIDDKKRVFNYRLSRAQNISENVFGILASQWKILSGFVRCSPENAVAIVRAVVCLHNFLISSADNEGPQNLRYCGPGYVDHELGEEHDEVEGSWRAEQFENRLLNIGSVDDCCLTTSAETQRNILRDYFNSSVGDAQVPWQCKATLKSIRMNFS